MRTEASFRPAGGLISGAALPPSLSPSSAPCFLLKLQMLLLQMQGIEFGGGGEKSHQTPLAEVLGDRKP